PGKVRESELGRAYSAPAITCTTSGSRSESPQGLRRITLPRICSGLQLQVELDAPARESQNFGIGVPPAAPVAGIVMVCAVRNPPDITMPLGTVSEGWSNGALWLRTRSSVSDLRKATTAALSSALNPAFFRLGSTSAEGKSPPRL